MVSKSNNYAYYRKRWEKSILSTSSYRSFANLFSDKIEFDQLLKDQKYSILVDHNLTISPSEYKEGVAIYYKNALRTIKPGLTQFLIHTAFDNDEMQAIPINHPQIIDGTLNIHPLDDNVGFIALFVNF